MSDTTTTKKTGRQASERQIAANRINATKSTGARTEAGRMRSSMNNCIHGLFSTKDLLPFECPIERQELIDDITAAAKPVDGVQRLLTERIIKTAWRVRRGERAQNAKATKGVDAIVQGRASEEARKADALGAKLDENVDAYHELLTFPGGLAYLLDQWSIILESLSQDLPLLGSQRQRCFSLVNKKCEHVLRSDRVATPWFLNLAGLMYGPEATLDEIIALLGTDPPEWMDEAEFVIRAERLLTALPTQAAAREALTGDISEIMKDLKEKLEYAKEMADRNLELDTAEACADVTPAGTKLTNAIDKIDRSCLAAIRRLEARQKPERPGPKGDSNQPATADEALDDLAEPDEAEPAAVAAAAEDAVAPEVPFEDPAPVAATMIEAEEPEIGGAPDQLPSAEPGPEKCEVEANCVYGMKGLDFERFGPEADRLRKVYHFVQAPDGTGEPGADLGRARADTPLSRAMEEFTRRQTELSHQLDAHFGIDGERPEPVVAEESAESSPLTRGDTGEVHERGHPEDHGLD